MILQPHIKPCGPICVRNRTGTHTHTLTNIQYDYYNIVVTLTRLVKTYKLVSHARASIQRSRLPRPQTAHISLVEINSARIYERMRLANAWRACVHARANLLHTANCSCGTLRRRQRRRRGALVCEHFRMANVRTHTYCRDRAKRASSLSSRCRDAGHARQLHYGNYV